MPELRQDPTTKEWVIIATDRAKRPDQFCEAAPLSPRSEPMTCPFCPGNEHLTPDEVFALRDLGGNGTRNWQIRVVPNRFAALQPTENGLGRASSGLFNVAAGFGYHEVIIESPRHDHTLARMSDEEILELLQTYRQRYEALKKDPRVKHILIFRNHGKRAGTSLQHPHSQLVATRIIPLHIRQKYEIAIRHFDDTARCLYCDIVAAERRAGQRVVLESPGFLVVHPFASQVPFETWIFPKTHNPCFAGANPDQLSELATVLRRTLRGLHDGLGNPDFNLMLHTAPLEDEDKPYFLWHIEIRPRLTTQAGFELGTGIYINTAVPEQTASFMRALLDASTTGSK